jgi:predicted dehydrogenase
VAAAFPGETPASRTAAIEHLAKGGHAPRVFDDWRDALDPANVERGIDAAIICGPFEQHAEMTLHAIARGVHVLCEKPVVMTLDELAAVRSACAASPQVHLAGMMFSRYAAGFYTARQLVARGAIGDVRLVNARKSYKMGSRGDYYRQRHTYGGTIPWVGSHAIDWSLWFVGHDVSDVQAFHSRVANAGNGDMEATAAVQFRTRNEAIVSVSIDVLRPGNNRTHGDDWIRVVGTTGVIEARGKSVLMTNAEGTDVNVALEAPPRAPLADFIAHAEGRAVALNERESTLAVTDVCLRARDAADRVNGR